LSGAAYDSAASIESWSCSYCHKYPFEDPKVFSNAVGGIQGFTGFSKGFNAIIVVFRGSNNIQNWILNIGTTRSSYSLCSNCAVHSGFLSGYNLVASSVRNAVQTLKAKYRTARLIVTGHSLGGALAILCTADLKNLFGTVDLTYTFGQPRVGNQAFANWFQATHPNIYRLIDYADIVPHLPPSNLGFLHSSHQVWYQRGMISYQLCDPEAATCANSIGTTNYSTDDHNLDNYLKLHAVQGKIISFVKALEEGALSLTENLRKVGSGRDWADEEVRKLNEFFGIFGEEYTFKMN
jgi:hypothetical protein